MWESVGTNGGLREQAVPAGVSHLGLTFNEKREARGAETRSFWKRWRLCRWIWVRNPRRRRKGFGKEGSFRKRKIQENLKASAQKQQKNSKKDKNKRKSERLADRDEDQPPKTIKELKINRKRRKRFKVKLTSKQKKTLCRPMLDHKNKRKYKKGLVEWIAKAGSSASIKKQSRKAASGSCTKDKNRDRGREQKQMLR